MRDHLGVAVSAADEKARLYQRQGDGNLATLAESASGVSLTSGTWYGGKVVVDNDPNDANLQKGWWAVLTLRTMLADGTQPSQDRAR